MTYRITCYRRGPKDRKGEYPLMPPINYNADSLAEMRTALLKAEGTRYAYKIEVSCTLAVLIKIDDPVMSTWQEVNAK